MLNKTPKGHTAETASVLSVLQKYLRPLTVVLVAVVVILVLVEGNHSSSPKSSTVSENCGLYRSDRVVTIGNDKIIAETTKKLSEEQKGLGGRPCIPANRGMLFGFNSQGYYPFWMKDMRFSIDIIWINSAHQVVGAYRNVSPSTYPQQFTNSSPAQFVLELKANRSKELGITSGTVINF